MSNSLSAAVEELTGVREAMLIDADVRLLFVVMQPGKTLDDALRAAVNDRVRALVPRQRIPDAIFAVPELPRSPAGGKHETAVRQIFTGGAGDPELVANPAALRYFVDLFNNL